MSPDDTITDIQISPPLTMARTGSSVSIGIEDITPVYVKITAVVTGVVDAEGTPRTAYRWRKQQMGAGGVWKDSDDGIDGFPAGLANPQQPLFSSDPNRDYIVNDIVHILPGVRDTQEDEDLNHGLEWWIETPPAPPGAVRETLRIQTGSVTSLGYKAYVQKYDVGSLSWIDKNTTEVRVKDRNGGGYEVGQLIHNALFIANDPVSGKDYYEGTDGLAGFAGIGIRGIISTGDQVLGDGYKMVHALALMGYAGAGAGGTGCLVGGAGVTYLLEDTTHYAAPIGGSYNLNSFWALNYIAAGSSSPGAAANILGFPASTGPFSVAIHDNGATNTYTGVTRSLASVGVGGGAGLGSSLNFVNHSGGTFPGSWSPYSSFLESSGGMYAAEFGIAQGPGITYRGLNGGQLGFTFSGGICIQVSNTYTIDGGTW